MKVDMVPSRRSGAGINLQEVMIIIAIIAIIAAVAIPALLVGSGHKSLRNEFEGKHVIVNGFEEVGLVTGVDGNKVMVYFPNLGEVGFKREMIRVVKGKR